MPAKTQHLQIRLTPQQKAALKRQAKAAGFDVSSYVLSRVFVNDRDRFSSLVRRLADDTDNRYVFAELNDFLHACTPHAYGDAVARADTTGLTPYVRNYLAAMVEHAAWQKGVAPPAWCREVEPLGAPHFAVPLKSLRAHLLLASPVPFKRRNIFIDAGVGARV